MSRHTGSADESETGESLYYRKSKSRFALRPLLRKLLRNKRLLLAMIVAVPLGGYVLFGNHGILQRIHLQREKKELEAKIRTAEDETRTLQTTSKALDGDKRAIEKVAREKHNMTREGERVYKVNPESK